jgi:hypothetical protein
VELHEFVAQPLGRREQQLRAHAADA